MDRREFLASAIILAVSEPSTNVTCDIWSSNEGDCSRTAMFEYADPTANRYPHPIGPRFFCKKHIGCASMPVKLLDTV